jgi:hypothetical protein
MYFKSPELRKQYKVAPALLKLIVEEFQFLSLRFGKEPTVTRISDPVSGESGVHPAGRAMDIRDEYMGKYTYEETEREALLNYINGLFPRTDGKKVIIHHSFGGGPFHFHIQIPSSPNSILLARNPFALLSNGRRS